MKSRHYFAQGVRQREGHTPLWWPVALATLMLHPYVVLLLDGTGADPAALAAHICIVLADLVLLGSALVLAVDARAAHCAMRANLATIATLVAVQDLPLAIIAVADPTRSGYAHRITSGHLLTVLVVALLVRTGGRSGRPPRSNPLVAGLALGLLTLAVRLVLLMTDATPYLRVGDLFDAALLATISLFTAAVCIGLMRSPLPPSASSRISIGVASLFMARLWASVTEAPLPPFVSIVGVTLSSAILATTSIALLLETLRLREVREQDLRQRAAIAEATVRHDREVVHEVRAATAGIVAGVHLLANDRLPPGPRRRALQHMVDVEAARLDRRMSHAEVQEITVLDLDDLIAPLVTAHAAQGHEVLWTASGLQAVGRYDSVTEIVNVLLVNAARHATGRDTAIHAACTGDLVEIWVSDRGPGLAPDVRDRLFEWGARTADSPGQGIGLQRARRLAQEIGGDLRHVEPGTPGAGTSFVVSLRAPARATERRPRLGQAVGMTG
ncbi:hypothetical protein CFH99_14200 [Nocardioides aromaticivorans]|uniref:histidine kinase n=2 Tax=Nocardioides aromaticivorans TaxID=200618 RepID=A0ABX7PM40_9ACTN|nr:hypothetical protein CFH99_14200 [Nocardioides aromaticivorans]